MKIPLKVVAACLALCGAYTASGQELQVYSYTGQPLTQDGGPPTCPLGGSIAATLIIGSNPSFITAEISGGGASYQGVFQGPFSIQNGQVLGMQIVGTPPGPTSVEVFTEYVRNVFAADGATLVFDGSLCQYSTNVPGSWSSVPGFQTPFLKSLGSFVPPTNPAGTKNPASTSTDPINLGGRASHAADDPCPFCGNPINISTGNKFQSEADFVGGPCACPLA
jgi:hypothetical protein